MKKMLGKALLFSAVGCMGLILSTNTSEAASYESMKKNVEEGTGLIFNPEIDGIMTQESSLEIIEAIEEEIQDLNIEEPTQEIYDEVFRSIKDLEVVDTTEKTCLHLCHLLQQLQEMIKLHGFHITQMSFPVQVGDIVVLNLSLKITMQTLNLV